MPFWVMLTDVNGFLDEMMGVEMCFPIFLYFLIEIASLLGSFMIKGEDGGGKTCFLDC